MFIRTLRADGRKVVLATQGSLYRPGLTPDEERSLEFGREMCTKDNRYPDDASIKRALDAMNANTRAIAKEQGVPLADLDAVVPKTAEYLRDDVHHTAKGARLAGQAIAEAILQAGFVH